MTRNEALVFIPRSRSYFIVFSVSFRVLRNTVSSILSVAP